MDAEHHPDEERPRRALSNGAVLRFAWAQWMRRPRRFAALAGLFLLATACDLAIPWAARGLVDAVSDPARRADAAWTAWAALTGLYAAFFACRVGAFRLMNVFSARNMEELANDAFARVQRFSADWHASNFAGATVRQLSRGMWGLDEITDVIVIMLAPALIVLVGLPLSLMAIDPLAGSAALALVLAYMGLNLFLTTRWVRPANLRSTALDSRIGAALADAVTNNPAVKSFGAEAREEARLARTTAAWRDAAIATWNRFNMVGMVMNVLLVALQAALTGLMVRQWARGLAGPGDVAFAITSFMLMAGYLRNFGEMVRTLQKGIDEMEDVAAHAGTPPQVADRPGAAPFAPGAGAIRFERVTFGYGDAPPLYRDFDLCIRPGERVALVGPTGAGKSTFVKLLQRLYEPRAGRILIDEQDIAGVAQESLRRAIAVVPQEPALFHRSIFENIAYARPDAGPDEVRLAARRARADDFIERLPAGYATLVGERGVKLSGGERQRVAIARAFLADAPVLVLDEATSSLDVETERQVQAATEALMIGRTTVVIAHRLSTIRSADRILVFEGGRVVEEGTHRELAALGGAYARLSGMA